MLEICPKEVVSSPEGVHFLCDILQERSRYVSVLCRYYTSVCSKEGSRSFGPTTLINQRNLYPKRVALEPRMPRILTWRSFDANGDIAPVLPNAKEEHILHMVLAAGNASVDILPIPRFSST
jgi:hypothetical protein